MTGWAAARLGGERDVEAARAAAYVLSEKAYVVLDRDGGELVVRFLSKGRESAEALERELRLELANQRLRLRLARDNAASAERLVREAVAPGAGEGR